MGGASKSGTNCQCRYELMLSCWNENVPQRPSFAKLQTTLDKMLEIEVNNPYIDFSINPNSLCYQVADENEPANGLLQITQPGANKRNSRLGSGLSMNISRSSSKSLLPESPTSSLGGCTSPTLEKPHGIAFEEEESGAGRRPRSMMLLRGRSPSQRKPDEDRYGS